MRTDTALAISGSRMWPRADTVVALLAVVILLPSSIALLTEPPTRPETPVVVLAAALYALLHLASVLAARYAVAAFGVASAAMLVLALTPGIRDVSGALFPSAGAFLLVTAQVAIRSRPAMRLLALGVGIVGAAIIAFSEPHFDDLMLRVGAFFGLSGGIAAAWSIGLLVRIRRARAEERVCAQVEQAIIDERSRINRDLHDLVAHSLTVMIAQAEVAKAVGRDDPALADRALDAVMGTGRDALRGMRAVVADAAPREPLPTIDSLATLVDGVRTPTIEIGLVEVGHRGRLRPDAAIALHHAVREALTNAVRHVMPPLRLEVRLEWHTESLRAVVSDDGGSGGSRSGLGAGTGLVGIAERVRLAGGTFTAGPGPSTGWTVTIELPADGEAP